MEWLEKLYGTVVGLDTAPLIYFMEKHPGYFSLVQPFFESVDRGEIQIVTSTLTLTEVLVHPFRYGNHELVAKYSRVLTKARNLRMLPVSAEIAVEAARIRAAYGTSAPDAIQLASVRLGGATSILTNDEGMSSIPGLQILILDRIRRESELRLN